MINNNKLLAAIFALAISSAAAADYSMQQTYYTGTASLKSAGACKLKAAKFADAKFGVIFDDATSQSFEGILSSDNQLIAQFQTQNLNLSDVKASYAKQDFQRKIISYAVAPKTVDYLINSGCQFDHDSNSLPIVQSIPAQNFIEQKLAKFRSKQGDWQLKQQVNMRVQFYGVTQKQKKCSDPASNCTATGAISNITLTFKHNSSTAQADRLFPQ